MKLTLAAVLLNGLLVAQHAQAEKQAPRRSRWVVIATIIDRNTGERLRETKLGGPELEFDDPVTCKAIIDRVHPTPTDHSAAVLTCREVVSMAASWRRSPVGDPSFEPGTAPSRMGPGTEAIGSAGILAFQPEPSRATMRISGTRAFSSATASALLKW